MTEPGKSFWHTAPGMITAVATLITALGGVLAILVQNDIIDVSRNVGSGVVTTTPGEGGDEALPEVASSEPMNRLPQMEASSLIPWDRSTATLVRQDGTSTTVKAPTVGLACAAEALEFENGQRVKLELVRSIQFDAIYVENSSADGIVTLLDGREFTDPIHTWNCPVTGANELGPVSIELVDIKRIDFHRRLPTAGP